MRIVGRPKGSYMGVFFYLKWRWTLNQEITYSAAQQGWCPCSAACDSWCIHHPAVCDGRMCTARTGAGRADGTIWLKNSPKQGLRVLAALSSWCIHPPSPPLLVITWFTCLLSHSLSLLPTVINFWVYLSLILVFMSTLALFVPTFYSYEILGL